MALPFRPKLFSTFVAALLWVPAAIVSAQNEVPTLKDRIDSYDSEQQAFSPPLISDKDRRRMAEAQEELEAQMPDPGLKIGETAPDFSLPNAHNKPIRLSDVLKQGPVVLTFYRGAWCPYCNLQLRALKESMPEMQSLGANLIAVTPQTPDVSLKQVEEGKFPFEILSDLDNSVMKNYKLYFELPQDLNELYLERFRFDLADYNGEGRYVLPVPGTYVIDSKGVVRAAYASVDYKKRMEPADIIAALKSLKTGSKS
jgi:peroxiredoxin